jgi:hypothetical protein
VYGRHTRPTWTLRHCLLVSNLYDEGVQDVRNWGRELESVQEKKYEQKCQTLTQSQYSRPNFVLVLFVELSSSEEPFS